MSDQLSRIESDLGYVRGTADAILRDVSALGVRLAAHVEDDKKLAERVGRIERWLARLAGIAAALSALGGIAGNFIARWAISGGHLR